MARVLPRRTTTEDPRLAQEIRRAAEQAQKQGAERATANDSVRMDFHNRFKASQLDIAWWAEEERLCRLFRCLSGGENPGSTGGKLERILHHYEAAKRRAEYWETMIQTVHIPIS